MISLLFVLVPYLFVTILAFLLGLFVQVSKAYLICSIILVYWNDIAIIMILYYDSFPLLQGFLMTLIHNYCAAFIIFECFGQSFSPFFIHVLFQMVGGIEFVFFVVFTAAWLLPLCLLFCDVYDLD